MRKRYQIGGIKKQRGRWVGMWWVDGKRKSRVLGFVNKLPKSAAREAVNRIVAEENAKPARRGNSASLWNRSISLSIPGNGNTRQRRTT